jgi:hypothetical protein
VNISRTGILFALATPFPPAETVDFQFALVNATPHVGEVRCVGHIVRESTGLNGRPEIAATIDQYLLESGS